MPVEKVCIVCGKLFTVPPSRALTAKVCSNACAVRVRAKSRERKADVVCAGCGVTFRVPRSQAHRRTYCSKECRYTSAHGKLVRSERTVGEKNGSWKGGETTHSCGYVYSLRRDHPFSGEKSGYIFKHRLIAEKALREECPESPFLIKLGGKLYLHPHIVVHHKDGNKKNNTRKNLVVCTPTAHHQIHRGIQPGPGTFWPVNFKAPLTRE